MNINKIDSLVDQVVLGFDRDETVKRVLSKLLSMRIQDNTHLGEKSISFDSTNFKRKIIVDKENSILELLEEGIKTEDSTKHSFSDHTYYQVENGNGLVCRNKKDVEISTKNNQEELISVSEKQAYDYYREGRIYARSFEEKKQSQNDYLHKIILKYNLLSGDFIERTEINGEVKYAYFENKKVYDNSGYNITEITGDDFKRIVSYQDSMYDILNDSLVRKIKR